jgi:segregation and condensation protein B
VTRGDIEQIRGVGVSQNIMRTLLERDWIRAVGQREAPGRPSLYGTTKTFLDYFNLNNLDQLPPLEEIRALIEPTLVAEGVAEGTAQDTAEGSEVNVASEVAADAEVTEDNTDASADDSTLTAHEADKAADMEESPGSHNDDTADVSGDDLSVVNDAESHDQKVSGEDEDEHEEGTDAVGELDQHADQVSPPQPEQN